MDDSWDGYRLINKKRMLAAPMSHQNQVQLLFFILGKCAHKEESTIETSNAFRSSTNTTGRRMLAMRWPRSPPALRIQALRGYALFDADKRFIHDQDFDMTADDVVTRLAVEVLRRAGRELSSLPELPFKSEQEAVLLVGA